MTSAEEYSNEQILTAISQDYLAFTLSHELGRRKCQFELNGIHLDILGDGIIAFYPNHINDKERAESKNIVLSCGIHGNETAPIEICNQIIHELLNNHLRIKHRVLFIFGNIPSMHIAERFVEENLNRLFTRKTVSHNQEGKRAVELMDHVDIFFKNSQGESIHYDLHTAIRPSKNEKFAVYPFLHGKPYSKSQLEFLAACEVKTILLSQSPTTTFSYYSSVTHNAHAFTIELGKVRPFGKNDMSRFTAVAGKLRELISQSSVQQGSESAHNTLEIFSVNQVINKQKDDFKLHFSDDIANFTEFRKGEIFASESGTEYRAQYDGEAIVFPNANVAIGQRAILTVIPYEI